MVIVGKIQALLLVTELPTKMGRTPEETLILKRALQILANGWTGTTPM